MHRLTSEAILNFPLTNVFERDRLLPGLVDAERAAICLRDLAERGRPTGFVLLASEPDRPGRNGGVPGDLNVTVHIARW
ncbi:hypothetical protein ACIRO3_27050 [Streptomyces sp. NPDC102278]|uniref:hypothetical protein n=1 Tax=Streptomyces sp. NPDC102278 TaxID=3366152 RepID=UPI00381ADB7D